MLLANITERNASFYGDRTAMVSGPTRISFREFNSRVNSLTNALSQLGVNKGDKVILMTESCHQSIEVVFAGIKGGVVISAINPNLPLRDLSYLINNAEANTVILGDNQKSQIDSIRAELKTVKNLIVIGTPQGQMKSYEELISSSLPNEPKVEHEEGDLLFLQYSGGTTGLPKQVMHTRKSALQTTLNTILNWRLTPGDVYLALAPPYWGQFLQLHCALIYAGCTTIFLSDINPTSILETIEKERVTISLVGGPLLPPLVDHQNTSKYNLSSLRHLSVGGVPVPPEVEEKAIETLGNVIGHLYGMTEHTFLTILHPEELATDGSREKTKRLRSSGRAGLNIRLRIVDDNGNDVALGQVGEIITAGYGMMEGYWKAPEATREAMMGSYLCTGDLATMDEQGYVYHAGRKKDVIVTGGKTVSPTEVEELIAGHGPVQEVAVIGVPDEELGQAIKAIVVLKTRQAATEEEIISLCQQNLPSYAVPKSAEFVDRLPRSTFGKVLRGVLREQYDKC